MAQQSQRRGFTLPELIVVLFVCVILAALLPPLLSRSRGDHNQNYCRNNLKQLAIALHNYESANRQYPPACFNDGAVTNPAVDWRPGDVGGGKATTGYSWIVHILPFIEENKLHRSIREQSQKFMIKTGPFTPVVNGGTPEQHASCVRLSAVICPSWIGDGGTNGAETIDVGPNCGAPPGYGAPEYANVDSSTPGTGKQSFKGKVAPTNYKPMVGTHMRKGIPVANGGMALGPPGLPEKAFDDGTSKTIQLVETRESGYASWYDGTLNWLVANDPNKPAPGLSLSPDTPPWSFGSAALNRGYNPAVAGSVPYLSKSLTANSPLNDVWWGPSSDHPEGIVMHSYADGHVIGITQAVDPNVYLDLTTRAGGEPIDDYKLN